ncbi:MAG: HAD-IG family 5'-nucleotidase [bacterium]|nr:HAD-IG family 5'-nucleotidase [bacterium]
MNRITAPHHFEQFVKKNHRIFVNRNLRMNSIRWVGFDLDHTLALYNRNFIEALAFDLAREVLVEQKGYPASLLDILYDPAFGIRGLVVDKKLGNILKMDKFHYVATAFHGMRPLSKENRKELYTSGALKLSSDRFWSSDTLFGLPEIALYASVVDQLELEGWPEGLTFRQLFTDIRYSVDLVHKDGTLKEIVMPRMSECFIRDPKLPFTLEKFRREGVKLFLLTNSDYKYSDTVLSWVLNDDSLNRRWWEYFDLIVVDAGKPGFFDESHNWAPYEDERHNVPCFSGGNFSMLQSQIGARGDEVLYIGDHIFGDILRSKKTSGWRTMMVVEELEYEILAIMENEQDHKRLDKIQIKNADLQETLRECKHHRDKLSEKKISNYKSLTPDQLDEIDAQLEVFADQEREIEGKLTRKLLTIKEVEETIDARFNPYWGPLCKVDSELSRFGDQLGDFACLYTSRVSNYLNYPPGKFFQSRTEFLPHEL